MTKSKKITLSASRDIPFNKLVLSQSNVRKVKMEAMTKHRSHSVEFKRQVAQEFLAGKASSGGKAVSDIRRAEGAAGYLLHEFGADVHVPAKDARWLVRGSPAQVIRALATSAAARFERHGA